MKLEVTPIGYLRSQSAHKYQVSPQPVDAPAGGDYIELEPGHNYEVGLRDLSGFSRIWLLWWFHRNSHWKPTTLPPRGRSGRKGVFATRSPYRPNPIAMSCVALVAVEGNKIRIGPHDLLADTPILDIKPYLPKFDAFLEETSGWFGEMEALLETQPKFEVSFSPRALSSLQQQHELKNHIENVLGIDPFPHKTRRICRIQDRYRLACGDWRVFFELTNDLVYVLFVEHREESKS